MFQIISLWGISRRARADSFVVYGPIWPKFEPIQNIMHVLKMDWINSNREIVDTLIFRRSMTAYSVVSLGILTKFELIQALIHVLITCKYH